MTRDDRELANEFFDFLRIDNNGKKCAAHRHRDALAVQRNYITFVLKMGRGINKRSSVVVAGRIPISPRAIASIRVTFF